MVQRLSGPRRGQRVEFSAGVIIRFGRHPASDIAFDAQRDLDASSHHAELRWQNDRAHLCDVGSSNGTFITGQRVTERQVEPGEPLDIEFGRGGPRVRLLFGDPNDLPPLSDSSGVYERVGVGFGLAFGLAFAAVLAAAVIAWIALV